MAMLPDVFNSEGKETMGFTVIPAGWYEGEIIQSQMKDTKAKTGKYLNLSMKIIDGEHKGRMVFTMLNLVNPNRTAVEIAQKELATICNATGVGTSPQSPLEDSDELHNIPIGILVGIQPASSNWPEKNIVKGYCPVDDIPEEIVADSDGNDDTPF